jgi:sulfopropanediol 3-dehydrogenase
MSRKIIKSAKPVEQSATLALQETVTGIIERVRTEGDTALRALTKQFDKVDRPVLAVSEGEKKTAWEATPMQAIRDLEFAAKNIRDFAESQKSALTEIEKEILPGVHVGHRLIPLASAGIYVPGGRYPLPSTALMGIIPARVAGVKRVVACSPPDARFDGINPITLVAMQIAGADEIYCVGGVQAVAALAYGTPSIRAVDIIAGPGNAYVTEAKRQVFGHVGIDFLAGPSEVLIIADDTANAELVAADLLAQAEHDPRAKPILVATSQRLIDQTLAAMEVQLATLGTAAIAQSSWEANGWIYLVSDLKEAVQVANECAPEHLEVHSLEWRSFWRDLINYGSLFLGEEAPVAFGDYTSGSNHTLPTMGTARLHGGLWVGMFLKVATYQWMSPQGAALLAPVTERFATMEGLLAHAASAARRKEA